MLLPLRQTTWLQLFPFRMGSGIGMCLRWCQAVVPSFHMNFHARPVASLHGLNLFIKLWLHRNNSAHGTWHHAEPIPPGSSDRYPPLLWRANRLNQDKPLSQVSQLCSGLGLNPGLISKLGYYPASLESSTCFIYSLKCIKCCL